jgi:hypothetical protein
VTLSGFTSTLTGSCSGCSTVIHNGTYAGATTVSGVVTTDTVAICQLTSSSLNTATTATLTIGTTVATAWSVTTLTTDSCAGINTIGATCPDGTVFAGYTQDGTVKAYVTPCDLGQTLVSGSCTGTRSTYAWNNGSGSYFTTGYSSTTLGKTNTSNLKAATTTGNPPYTDSPYNAAVACANLSGAVALGYNDWYLPGHVEGTNTYANATNYAAIGGFSAGSVYWMSNEVANNTAGACIVNTSNCGANLKSTATYYVRCMRHN